MRGERAGAAGGGDRGFPFVARADIGERQRGQPLRHFEDAREIFRALDVAREPVQVVGGAREHAYVSSTQVSLVPPPWLELTTSEPFFSATRVSPPGTIRTRSRPTSTNGRRSTWRGAMPSSTQVGTVESASVGWAMKFFGDGFQLGAEGRDLRLVGLGADQHAVAAGAVHLLHDQLFEMVEHIGEMLRLAAAPGRHVLQERLFAEVEFHDRGHVAVDRLVVGDAGADRVGERHVAGLVGRHQARHAERGIRDGRRGDRGSRRRCGGRSRRRAAAPASCACRRSRPSRTGRGLRPARRRACRPGTSARNRRSCRCRA